MEPDRAPEPGPLPPKRPWFFRVLIAAGAVATVIGLGLEVAGREPWRWVTWAGLVTFTWGVVLGWWVGAPAPPPAPGPEGTRAANQPADRVVQPRGGYWLTRFLANRLEPFFAWLVAYPVFPLPIVVFWAIAWFDLAGGLGVPDLVWGDRGWMRFWVGLSVSLLFSNVLFIRAVLDRRPGSVPPDFGERWSLFWFVGDDRPTRQVGAFLLWTWLPTLLVFYAAYAFRDWSGAGGTTRGGMFLGLALGVGLNVAFVALYKKLLDRWWQGTAFFQSLPAFRGPHPAVDRDHRPLHALAGIMTLVPVLMVLVLGIESAFFDAIWSPVWVFCLLLGLFNAAYGFVTFHLAGLQYVLAALGAALVFVCNTGSPNRMSHPGLEGYAAEHVNLDEPPPDANPPLDLVGTGAMLETFHTKKWATNGRDGKPKLVIVATTGGGIQAAVWTALVLEKLEAEMPGNGADRAAFRDHIRLITGASGGTQAAGLYAADFEARDKPVPLSELLAEDSLWPTFQTMLTHDLPALAWPGRLTADRGRTLENRWEWNTSWAKDGRPSRPPQDWSEQAQSGYTRRPSPFAQPFHSLRAAEARCERPSLILSPMLVEDCRRLLISNLAVDWFTETSSQNMNPQAWYQPEDHPDRTAVPAVEFWRYFPKARDGLKVSTAARMAATFPFVGPAVSLPTTPARRVVDAGYFDNFGVNLAGVWLYRHRELIRQHTSGVVIVEVRAYPRRAEKLRFDLWHKEAGGEQPASQFNWAAAEVGTPFRALYNLYARSAYFRNDQMVDVLDLEFNGPRGNRALPAQPFFTTVCFECDQGGSLNWTLPRQDFDAIKSEFAPLAQTDPPAIQIKKTQIQKALENLKSWFDAGGTGAPAKGKP